MAQTWENPNPRSYFAASKGRAVIDPIWRHAAMLVVRLYPRVTLDVFIDDYHQSAQGTPREARKLIVAAGRNFTEEAQKHLRVRFADKKTAIVSSHQKLALSVALQLGSQKEAVKTQTVGLGVDVSAGKSRTVTSAQGRRRGYTNFPRGKPGCKR